MDTAIIDLVKELQQIRIDIQSNQRRLEDTIRESLSKVDDLQHLLNDEFDLTTAVALCKAGYFVQHVSFNSKESMHYYDATLYHEDGTEISVQELKNSGMESNWRVKKNPLEIDLVKLRDIHVASGGIIDGSYEQCFK